MRLFLAAFYISSEGLFPQRRFTQIVSSLKQQHPELAQHDFLEQLVLEQVGTAQRLLELLTTTAPHAISHYNVRLIVLDSIAALFREFGSDEMIERAKLMWRIAQQLKVLAEGCRQPVFVIVTNQVSSRLDGTVSSESDKRPPVPALGLSWASYINTRLLARRTERVTSTETSVQTSPVGAKRKADEPLEDDHASVKQTTTLPLRELSIAFAGHLPSSGDVCSFIVDRGGVRGVAPVTDRVM